MQMLLINIINIIGIIGALSALTISVITFIVARRKSNSSAEQYNKDKIVRDLSYDIKIHRIKMMNSKVSSESLVKSYALQQAELIKKNELEIALLLNEIKEIEIILNDNLTSETNKEKITKVKSVLESIKKHESNNHECKA